jgi:hypothetical protein
MPVQQSEKAFLERPCEWMQGEKRALQVSQRC